MTTHLYFDDCLKLLRYIELTKTHGPSQILLDFINYDQSLSQGIGLESFESFSTLAQHELFLDHFEIGTMLSTALESLTEDLDQHLQNNEEEIAAIKASQKGGSSGFLSYLSTKFKNAFHSKVTTFEETTRILKAMEVLIAIDEKIVSVLPKNSEHSNLAKFYADLHEFAKNEDSQNKKSLAAVLAQRSSNLVLFENGNWSTDRLNSVVSALSKLQARRAHVLVDFNHFYQDMKRNFTSHASNATRAVKIRAGRRYDEATNKYVDLYADHQLVDFNQMSKDGKLLSLVINEMARLNRPFATASGFMNSMIATIDAKLKKQASAA